MECKKEHKGVWKVHGRCTEGMQGCAKVCKGMQVVAPGDGIVGAGPVHKKSKIFECVPVLTGLTVKNRLRVDWGGVVVVAQGQEVCGGSASGIWRAVAAQVGGGGPEQVCMCA